MSIKSSGETHTEYQDETVGIFSEEEAAALFERLCQRYMGMSGDEFIRRWDAGEYSDDPDRPGVMDAAMLLPLVRH